MTEKTYTSEEINKRTNQLIKAYSNHYRDGKMSFAEWTLIENVIMKVQLAFHEVNGDNNE